MSYEESLRSVSFDADASIGIYTGPPGLPGSPSPHGAKQYHFVKVTGANQVGLAGATDRVIGVLQNKPQQAGAAATVGIRGISNVVAGEAIDAGEEVGPNASGAAAVAAAGDGIGIALQDAASGSLVPVLLV
ncbi:MAG TPA: DUF2190 family protein [Actinomycetota bacterium]|nr:DUF2190 family protein [Actinomycetota bacterium]